MRTPSIITLGLLLSPAFAQFQLVHEVPTNSITPQITPLILADGSLITHQWMAGEHIFRKYDGAGDLLWSKGLEGILGVGSSNAGEYVLMAKDGSDGFLFVRQSEATETPIMSEPFWEMLHEWTYEIGRVNGDGELMQVVHVKKNFTTSFPGDQAPGELNMDRTADGGVVFIISTGPTAPAIDVVKVAANGTLEWARSVGSLVAASQPFPAWAFDSEVNPRVRVSPIGNIFYTEGTSQPYAPFRLAALDSDGEMLWMKRYTYGNTSPITSYHGLAVDEAGRIHTGGSLSSSVGRFHIFLRTTAEGILDRTDIYRTPDHFTYGDFAIDGSGRRITQSPGIAPVNTNMIFIADTLGSPGHLLRGVDQVVLPNNVFLQSHKIDASGERLVLGGLLNHEHVDLAYTTRYGSVLSFTNDEFASCFVSDSLLAHIPVPLEIMSTEIVSTAVAIDVSEYYTTETVTVALTDLDPEPIGALCEFGSDLLGIEIGIPEGTSDQTPLVTRTLVPQGMPLVLNSDGPITVDVFTACGTLVHRSQLNGSRMLETTGWTSGIYVVRSTKDARVARVVVE